MKTINLKLFFIRYSRFIRYLLVGLLNAVIAFATYYLLIYLNFHYQIANVSAFLTSSLNGYFWNRVWVFKDSANEVKKTLIKYYIVYVTSLLWSLLIAYIWIDVFHFSKYIVPWVTLMFSTPYNYGFNKLWTFK